MKLVTRNSNKWIYVKIVHVDNYITHYSILIQVEDQNSGQTLLPVISLSSVCCQKLIIQKARTTTF